MLRLIQGEKDPTRTILALIDFFRILFWNKFFKTKNWDHMRKKIKNNNNNKIIKIMTR